MTQDPTQRFSSRVAAYVAARPSYPDDVIGILGKRVGLCAGVSVADIGSGTGKLSELLLDHGCRVFGVEPNEQMRHAAEALFSGSSDFVSVAARAEETTLPDGSVDLVVAGQALHWFDLPRARAEMLRILRAPGYAAFVWNVRKADGTRFMADYEALVDRCAREDPGARHEWVADDAMAILFGAGRFMLDLASYEQSFDLDGLRARFLSASYTPGPDDPRHGAISQELARIWQTRQVDGRVTFFYDTKVYSGCLRA